MRILGLDLGNKTVGIAISDPSFFLARGLETYRFKEKDFEDPLKYILSLTKKYNLKEIVLGLPKNMDNTEGIQASIIRDFKQKLEQKTSVKIVLYDERLTSKVASDMMKAQKLRRKKRQNDIDKMAAVVILQNYLDSL